MNSIIQLLNDPFEIEDPYYGDDKGFEIVYDKIYQGCKRVLNSEIKINTLYNTKFYWK